MLLSRIRLIHERSYGTYGAPRIHAELRESGIRAGRKRVARLMRMAAISGVSRRRAVRTTWRSEEGRKAPDLVNRNFTAPARDRLWVADITYVPTHAGFLYLSVVIDASVAASSAGPWPTTCEANWSRTPWIWPLASVNLTR